MPNDTHTAPAKLPAVPPPEEGSVLLDEVTEFIGRYLDCSEHQRTVMALWILHTHCLPAAQVTPYLAIQSSEKESGKTLCLELLSLLCDFPALTAGFSPSTLSRRIDDSVSTVLLDECQAILGTRVRSKGPMLRALLASGFHRGVGYSDSTHERNIFCPKAFAGMGQLPKALADRSISIILEPVTDATEVERFDLHSGLAQTGSLKERLHLWAERHLPELKKKPPYAQEDFPPNLSPRRQDMIEPLLQLADYIGSAWPTRIREAIVNIFQEEVTFELKHSVQLLADVRDCFAHHYWPERLSTAALLAWLHNLPTRPWDVDGPITARTFARLLSAFDIQPRVQRIGSDALARGYQLQDFVPHWETHLGFNPAQVTDEHQSEIANNDKGCYAVTDSGALSVSPVQTVPVQTVPVETVLSTVSLPTVSLPTVSLPTVSCTPARVLSLPKTMSGNRVPPQPAWGNLVRNTALSGDLLGNDIQPGRAGLGETQVLRDRDGIVLR